jgi:hypothetical protein
MIADGKAFRVILSLLSFKSGHCGLTEIFATVCLESRRLRPACPALRTLPSEAFSSLRRSQRPLCRSIADKLRLRYSLASPGLSAFSVGYAPMMDSAFIMISPYGPTVQGRNRPIITSQVRSVDANLQHRQMGAAPRDLDVSHFRSFGIALRQMRGSSVIQLPIGPAPLARL